MKLKSIITLALLFTMSFSVVHEYVFTFYDNDHCSLTEYVSEFDTSNNHGDICDIHFEYHMAYILPFTKSYHLDILPDKRYFSSEKSVLTSNSIQLYKPPTT